ncbi:MAG: hypothetical protein KatS3mg118_2981 [Paracoccaceae bacterium]|nr:MAG: hypothetical protein KatS3mg118_2981 [Paracoccaceae bacterium]
MTWPGVASPELVSPHHPYSPAEIAALPIISYRAGSPPDHLIEAWFRDAGCTPAHLNASNSMATMITLASEGLGLAAIPPVTIERQLADGTLVELALTRPMPPVPFTLSHVELPGNAVQRRTVAEIRRVAGAFCSARPRASWG